MGKILQQNFLIAQLTIGWVVSNEHLNLAEQSCLTVLTHSYKYLPTFTGQTQTAYWVFTIKIIQGRSTSVDTFPVLLGLDCFHNKVLVSADDTSGHNRFYLFVWGNFSCQYITAESGQLAKHPAWGPIWWAALCLFVIFLHLL